MTFDPAFDLFDLAGQVHAGNVLVCGGGCKLVDIENTLMGVPSQYRHFLVEIKKIRVTIISPGYHSSPGPIELDPVAMWPFPFPT